MGNWESGLVKRPGYLVELAHALATTPEWLMHEEGPEELIPNNPQKQIQALLQDVSVDQAGAVIQFLKNLTKKRVGTA